MREKVTDIAAAILAGGKNSRMEGRNKAFLKVNGSVLIERTIELLKGIFEEVIIVTNSPLDFKSYGKETVIITDKIKGAGPLGGIHSALSTTKKEAVFFVACDMPFLHNALILRLLKDFGRTGCDCLVPKIGDSIEPLHAVYKKSLKDKINTFVKKSADHSVRNFLKTANVCYLDLENNGSNQKIFNNLNTKEDLKKSGGTLCG